jgi:hypothetical protein
MATNTGTKSKGSSSKSQTESTVPMARNVQTRLREDLAPAARKTGKQIGRAFQATAKAAEKTAKVLAVRARVSARELRIRSLYLKIGESYYRGGKSGIGPQETAAALQPLVDKADKLHREIASLKLQEKKIRSGK